MNGRTGRTVRADGVDGMDGHSSTATRPSMRSVHPSTVRPSIRNAHDHRTVRPLLTYDNASCLLPPSLRPQFVIRQEWIGQMVGAATEKETSSDTQRTTCTRKLSRVFLSLSFSTCVVGDRDGTTGWLAWWKSTPLRFGSCLL